MTSASQSRRMWLLAVLISEVSLVESASVKVMMLHNSAQSNAGWKEGFYDFFVPYVNAQGFTIAGGTEKHTLDMSLCEEDLSVDAVTKVNACVSRAETEGVDAIVVGTSSSNDDIKTAAEAYKIPNLHCSGRLACVRIVFRPATCQSPRWEPHVLDGSHTECVRWGADVTLALGVESLCKGRLRLYIGPRTACVNLDSCIHAQPEVFTCHSRGTPGAPYDRRLSFFSKFSGASLSSERA